MLRTLMQLKDSLSLPMLVMIVLTYAVILLVCLPVHEWAHAYAASRLGDPTARYAGRLTLNPFRHLHVIGSAMILLVGFGFANPVPVDPRYFRHPRRDMAITALMGPLSNLAMAFIGTVALRIALPFLSVEEVGDVLYYQSAWGLCIYELLHIFITVNIGLAVFNLIPVPPLDGSRILSYFLPNQWESKIAPYERYITPIVLALVVFGLLDRPLALIENGILRLFRLILFF